VDLFQSYQLQPFRCNVIECPPINREPGISPGELLKSPNSTIHISWIELDQSTFPVGFFASDQRAARTRKAIEDRIPRLAAVPNCPLNQLHRLLGGMQFVDRGFVYQPQITLVTRAAPEVLCALAPPIEDRLVLPLVVGPPQRKVALGPMRKVDQ